MPITQIGCSSHEAKVPSLIPNLYPTIFLLLWRAVNGTASNVKSQLQHIILPLGDSITSSGFERLSYRYYLWKALIERGLFNFDFVGSLQDNFRGNPQWPSVNGQAFDRHHEGHWGWRIDQVLDAIDDWKEVWDEIPTIALVHLGTNNCFQEQNVQSTLYELDQVRSRLQSYNQDMCIILAQLIPSTSGSSCIVELNSRIPELIANGTTLVDMYSGFDANFDTWDGTHPNDKGAVKMADKWLNAILACANNDDTPVQNPTNAPSLLPSSVGDSTSWASRRQHVWALW